MVRARDALARACPGAAVDRLTTALGLWRGRPYEPLACAAAQVEAERLDGLRWHARYVLAEALVAAGRACDAITLLGPLTVADPLREKTWEHLLRALSADDRWTEALVAYDRARRVLAAELGVGPGPELRRLHGAALRAAVPRPGGP